MLQGIDISHFQDPKKVGYETISETYRFAYVRSSYGDDTDERGSEHLERAKDAGMRAGFYHFFRHHQPLDAQLGAFMRNVETVEVGAVTLPHALDLEPNKYDPAVQDWKPYAAKAEALALKLDEVGPAPAIVYMSPAWFIAMGSPQWIVNRKIWIADYDALSWKKDWSIWQHGTTRLPSGVVVDANRAKESFLEAEPPPAPAPTPAVQLKPGDALYVWPDGSLRPEKPWPT